jgi:hypothetical protein
MALHELTDGAFARFPVPEVHHYPRREASLSILLRDQAIQAERLLEGAILKTMSWPGPMIIPCEAMSKPVSH